ncbi:MAG: PilT/PilU family type 4a pilus ATPase, partial [Deltaproteobacteria bacterium]|nr:PilT/PilU family type 4a pilus ATPase [Deltaproteobacteria bacterium]
MSLPSPMPERGEARIEKMLQAMADLQASDLFVSEQKTPAVRQHGVLVPLKLPPTSGAELQRFLEKALPEAARQHFLATGDLDAGYTLAPGRRFRLNLARQMGSISLVARALPRGELSFAELKLPEQVAALAGFTRGLVLVTGATGSGKSTTLAAMIHHINTTRRVHVVTIEEPIEFVHRDLLARITQREVGVDTASFTTALRQVVRESPDVILIGELRDLETMTIALQAALTGHLVLASLHTIDACQTLQRLLSYYPAHLRAQAALDLSLSLQGVVAQRLLPQRHGQGRVVAVELLTVGGAVARLIREQRLDELQDLMKLSSDPGMTTFNRSLIELFRREEIGYETGLAHASNPEEFALAAQGMQTGVATFRGSAGDGGKSSSGLDLRLLLGTMLEREASDLHLSVGHPPMLRIRGLLETLDLPRLTASDVRVLLYSILGTRQRSTYELERELDFALAVEGGRRFRVNAYYEKGNMAAALRAIPARVPDAATLRLPQPLLELCREPQGLLLAVGPTGAGKTTTLACLVDRINHTRRCHVITIEDPIEYSHHSELATIHQREIGADTLTFAAALKYVLRQDPDVILVGELRDLETISVALTAAETGHLVLATLHS